MGGGIEADGHSGDGEGGGGKREEGEWRRTDTGVVGKEWGGRGWKEGMEGGEGEEG